jgi:hypothetical protein
LKVQTNGERDFTPQEMKFTMKKVNGEWLIREAETVRTLSQRLNKMNRLNGLGGKLIVSDQDLGA